MNSGKSMTRAALGSSASLGDLYDARRDDFCGISIFKKEIPVEAVTVRDSHFSDISLVHSDELSDKFRKLDVCAELSVSVLAGLFTLTGSGRYLSDQKISARTVKSSLVYNIKTKEESVNIYHEHVKDAFAIDAIESGVATHVVAGISWGANSVISCQYENNENRDVKEVKGILSAQLKKMSLYIPGNASVDFTEGDNSKGIKFEIRMFGDVLPKDEDLPTTFESALELMKKLPRLVRESNEGKGKPLSYRLIPISLLKDYLKFSIKADSAVVKTLEAASLVRVVQLFDHITAAQQRFHDFYQDALEFKICVKPEDLLKISELKNNMATQEAKLRSDLAKVLTGIRSGKNDDYELEELLKESQSSNLSPVKVSRTLAVWGQLAESINFTRALVQSGATYIGWGSSLDEEILKHYVAKSFVFYFTQRAKSEDAETWKGNRQLFFQEMKKSNHIHKFYAVDCDIHPYLMVKDCTSCVQLVQAGKILNENLLNEQDAMVQAAVAQVIYGTERVLYKPNKRVPLDIPCTGNNCNPNETYEWVCEKCTKIFDYGFDEHVYCDCGKTPVTCLEFKCTDPNHGLDFERHDIHFLIKLVNALRPFNEMNILLLGETGVGKSTWVNGFINFVTFESLKEAENGKLCSLIPSEFTVFDRNLNEVVVRTGTDENEVFQAGQSGTQEPKVYSINVGNTNIRLFDTPGIGDSRGIEQDKRNFQNVLQTLSNLDEIHGICILLKPNNAKLNVTFRFCIKELLTYLHRDASKNIVFCFTNTRGTFYRPGDTMLALKNLLRENKDVEIPISPATVYCFDSEAYRFLAAVKNTPPVSFSESERDNFVNSWTNSVEETVRMLEHIKGLEPHKIKGNLSLNQSRELVLRLAQPLAEIKRIIQINKSIVEDEKTHIENPNESIQELKKKLMITRTEIEFRRIDYPKTVCSNSACVKVWTVNNGTSTEYKTCHERCRCVIGKESIGTIGLRFCSAFRWGKCKQENCRHSFDDHLHVYYDSVQVTKQVEDVSVKKILNMNLSAAEMKQKMIEAKNKEVMEYEDELKKIQQASVRFAYFLKHNAITPYNDAIEQYLEHLIREEEDKVARGGSRTTLDYLKINILSYREQKLLLEQEMEKGNGGSGGAPPGPVEVEKLAQELQKLKHSGKTLKDALECIEHSKSTMYHVTTVNYPMNWNEKKAKKNKDGARRQGLKIFLANFHSKS